MNNFVQRLVYKLWTLSTFTVLTSLLTFWFLGLFPALIVLLVGFSGILYNAQDSLLYYPNDPPDSRFRVLQPCKFELPYENIKLNNKDGYKIHMFLIKQLSDSNHVPTIIFFHGNAGNIGQRLLNVSGLYHQLQVNILLVEYRGYGFSEGIPSEQGFYTDAQVVIDYIIKRRDINISKLVVFGRSLGGAVAIDLVSRTEYRNKIWALIVENTFTSIPDMARVLLRWKCLKLLPEFCYKNKYCSIRKIVHVTSATLLICGSADALVPYSMSNDLFVRCGAMFKKLSVIAGGGHDDTWVDPEYYPILQQFLQAIPSLPLEIGPFFDVPSETNTRETLITTV